MEYLQAIRHYQVKIIKKYTYIGPDLNQVNTIRNYV